MSTRVGFLCGLAAQPGAFADSRDSRAFSGCVLGSRFIAPPRSWAFAVDGMSWATLQTIRMWTAKPRASYALKQHISYDSVRPPLRARLDDFIAELFESNVDGHMELEEDTMEPDCKELLNAFCLAGLLQELPRSARFRVVELTATGRAASDCGGPADFVEGSPSC